MKLTYDPRYNIAYLRLQARTAEVETVRVNDAIHVDVAPDGTVYGIELLNANEHLWAEDEGGTGRGQRGVRRAPNTHPRSKTLKGYLSGRPRSRRLMSNARHLSA